MVTACVHDADSTANAPDACSWLTKYAEHQGFRHTAPSENSHWKVS